jgi:tRNA (Thr-GGU) A37 N-methylase
MRIQEQFILGPVGAVRTDAPDDDVRELDVGAQGIVEVFPEFRDALDTMGRCIRNCVSKAECD